MFTAEYKAAMLDEYDAVEPGEKGAILRREGLYTSHEVDRRRSRDVAALAALTAAPSSAAASAERVEMPDEGPCGAGRT